MLKFLCLLGYWSLFDLFQSLKSAITFTFNELNKPENQPLAQDRATFSEKLKTIDNTNRRVKQ